MNIQPEIICAAGVPDLLLDLVALSVLPIMKYFIERLWTTKSRKTRPMGGFSAHLWWDVVTKVSALKIYVADF